MLTSVRIAIRGKKSQSSSRQRSARSLTSHAPYLERLEDRTLPSTVPIPAFIRGQDQQIYAYTTNGYTLTQPGQFKSFVVGQTANNRLELFAIGQDSQVYAQRFDGSGNSLGAWSLAAAGTVKSIATGNNPNGNPQLFALQSDDQLYALKLDANGQPLGNYFLTQPGRFTQLAVGYDAMNRAQVWTVGTDSRVYTQKFGMLGNSAGDWVKIPGKVKSVSVGQNPTGKPQTFIIAPDNFVYTHKFDDNGMPVGTYQSLGSRNVSKIVPGHDGTNNLEIFVLDSGEKSIYARTFDVNGNSTGGYFLAAAGQVKNFDVGFDADNHPKLFAIGLDDQVYYATFLTNGLPMDGYQLLASGTAIGVRSAPSPAASTPSVNAGADQTANEGAWVAFSGSVTGGTAPYTYFWTFGDGSSASGTLTPSHAYADNGVYTTTLTVTDSKGLANSDTLLVTVNNVAPTGALANSGSTKEGSTATVSFSSQFDPSSTDTAAGFQYSYDFNNDGTFEISNSTSASATVPATYLPDGPGTRKVRAQIKDKDGGFTDYSTTITITNVAPTPNANGPYTGQVGAPISFNGSATDPSSVDTAAGFTWLWEFGDGATSTQKSPTHAYNAGGTYTVKLTATDKDSGTANITTTATVSSGSSDFITTPYLKIPNFGKNPTIVSVGNGDWSNPSMWSLNRLPTTGDVVSIAGGTTMTYDVSSTVALKTVAIQPGGTLTFRTDISTSMTVINLLVMEGGELRIGTSANPVAPAVKAEVIFANVPLDTTNDPSQYGNGLVGLGKVTMHGAVRSDSFVRLTAEPKKGDTTLQLAEPVTGWQVGDKLVLPDSKHWAIESGQYVPEYEEANIAAISSDGRTLTLTAALLFNHPGARNGDDVLEFLPHVGNRTRNVVIKSASSSGTRGHTFFTYRADVDIRYVGFGGLGRTEIGDIDNTTYNGSGGLTHVGTNQDDRFPVNFSHLMGPKITPPNGFQFTFVGNAVFCAMPDHRFKWGVTLNDSHYGLIQDNFVYNWAGAGLATEDGNESFNVIERNFVVRGRGEGDREGSGNPGSEGAAFWFRGPNNYVRDNVAANYLGDAPEAAYGYKPYFSFLGDVRIPKFKGADTSVAGEYTVKNGNAMPLLEFARNEVYGLENALSLWWLNAIDTDPQNGGTSTVKDFRGWHISRYGFYGYPMADVTFDGYVIRGKKSVLGNPNEFLVGMWFGDYMTKNVVIRNADIQCMRTGIIDPYFGGYTTVIENSYLRNTTNISVRTLGAPGSSPNGAWREPKNLIIRNVRYGSTSGWNHGGNTPYNINMDYTLHNGSANLIESDTVFVYDYDGVAGDNFQVYYKEQVPGFLVPKSSGNLVGSPEAGLTNQQNWTKYGIAIAGAVATNTTTKQGIDGLILPF